MPKLTIALVGKTQTDTSAAPLLEIAHFAQDAGHTVVIEEETTRAANIEGYPVWSTDQIGDGADLCVVLGGDGTMLGIARKLAPFNVPLIGINQGRLGFMTDIPLDEMTHALGEIFAGHYEVEERRLLEATLYRTDDVIFKSIALNDVVVSRGALSGMVELTVDVDGRFMSSQRSDGLIISTPTGSTAYALSADGPILHPQLQGIVLVPIAPHSLSNRPIVLPDSCRIDVTVTGGRDISVNFDMQTYTSLQHGDRVSIVRAPTSIRFLHPAGYSYFATLRQKLHWNEHPVGVETRPPTPL